MAKVQNTLIGRASGSVGGATFTTWKGINVLKSKPESVANPNTLGQRSQRSRLSVMVAVYRLIAGLIAIGFKSRAIGKSAYNAFMSSNINNATQVNAQGIATTVYANLKIALGTIGSTAFGTVTATSGNAAVISTFSTNNPIGGNASDIPYGAVYNATQDTWDTGNAGDVRSDGEITIPVNNQLASGDVLHLYLFFKSDTNADVSDSVYTTVTVA